ncbi:MAG: 4-diphosphocytidyl-2C-methyl-D-erythritol kinase [Rhodospirillales bacterium]|nr:4-diphosphocytidyl-2C-methyl-D-erythritol kinase [Rhodospirillales bacterium]
MPLAMAGGGILAHSVRRDRLVFRKGQRLGRAELAALADAGIADVTVALLEPGDVAEDEAARRVAGVVQSSGVVEGAPATGRVNLFATHTGLLSFDQAAIDAVNAVTEDVTLATFPLLAPVEAGRMVVTVKIIPFAVRDAVLERCIDAGRTASITVRPFRPLAARLIQTVTADLKPSVMAKTSTVTADRMARLGGTVTGETRCPHDVERLSADMAAALKAGCDILLVIGASAIVDRRDVIPAAMEALGGRIERLGMPVDPGNLILIGEIGATPVLGLPGCARSPARNGLDWVLERISAGLPVTHDIVAGMGVGGLLIGREEEKDYL